MNNSEMKANRIYNMQLIRNRFSDIMDWLNKGGIVVISTYTKAVQYDKRHIAMFKATKTSLYVQRGKSWDCINGAVIRFYKP